MSGSGAAGSGGCHPGSVRWHGAGPTRWRPPLCRGRARIELRPTLPVPLEEMWFWGRGRQVAEREAEEDLAAGRFRAFDDEESFLADLAELAAGDEHGR